MSQLVAYNVLVQNSQIRPGFVMSLRPISENESGWNGNDSLRSPPGSWPNDIIKKLGINGVSV